MAKKSQNTQKTSKSTSQQKKEVGGFIAAAIVAGAVATKKATKGKSKKQKASIRSLAFVLVVAIIVCGALFYMDIAPFNFEINGDMFKYYTYKPIIPSTSLTGVETEDFRLHVIDVHQGDCILLQLPDGKNMLIDGADKSKTLTEGIINYLLSDTVGLKNEDGKVILDYVVLTHTDADHCGSLNDVINHDSIDVLNVYRPMVMSKYANDPLKQYALDNNYSYDTITTTVYSEFVQAVYEEDGCNIFYNIGDIQLSGNGYNMYFFNPTYEMYQNMSTPADKNNVSPIILLEVYGKTIALTGDADAEQEENFLAQLSTNNYGVDVNFANVDVLKVAHHGGKESTTQNFLNTVLPEYALISVGEGNKYGHPKAEVLSRLNNIGCGEVYRTDKNGTIVLTISSVSMQMSWDFSTKSNASASSVKNRLNLAFLSIVNLAKCQMTTI
ncbi:MAG: hypothetical protein IKV38_03850 [Clostridia bacterium]|nr:hypothetical protein [Clostridia bacterium]